MNKIIITLNSVTYASRAKKLLWDRGIPARIIKTEESLAESGCKFGVEIPYTSQFIAFDILRSHDIEFKYSRG